MGNKKPTLYEQFKERVLTDLNNGEGCVWREKYIDWTKAANNKRLCDSQKRILHKVMEDLVRENLLLKEICSRRAHRYMFYYNKIKKNTGDFE
jgi:RNA polymerase-interacting CarD/CdnL/TRCF family regulator